MEPIAETIPEAILSEESSDNTAIPATPEYVAEVKAELSEQRRAGFRFFAQKKTKIMAGSLITLSLVAIALLSSPFLSESIQKSGKTNIQETIKNGTMGPIEASGGTDVENTGTSAVTPTGSVTTAPISPVEITSYEIGRDYSVAKNTKKNTRTKTSSGATSGTGAPTP